MTSPLIWVVPMPQERYGPLTGNPALWLSMGCSARF